MASADVRVVKVGGSLFAFDRLVPVLRDWLNCQSRAMNMLIAGAGELADFVRECSARFDLTDKVAHWMCIDLMSVSAGMLHQMLPESNLITDFHSLRSVAVSDAKLIVYDVHHFMHEIEPNLAGERLPQNWTVTSDSIAARVAGAIDAVELVLLKSTITPAASLTDDFFTIACQSVRNARVVNLRAPEFDELSIVAGGA